MPNTTNGLTKKYLGPCYFLKIIFINDNFGIKIVANFFKVIKVTINGFRLFSSVRKQLT